MDSKICTKCNISKTIDCFYSRGPKENNAPTSWCKTCLNKRSMEKWKQKRLDAIKYLGGICVDCKQSFHPNVFDFHHLHDKDFDWAKLKLRSDNDIKKELDKCILLCSNCHRMRHI